MINTQRVEHMLRSRYRDLEQVGRGVFRGMERFNDREYAIRYFDLNDDLDAAAKNLKSYQERLLSKSYFSADWPTDLRWNHYLYFITSDRHERSAEFERHKAAIESDREYARKQVIKEDDVPVLLENANRTQPAPNMPVDLATKWLQELEVHGLGFVLDEEISVPEVVRRVAAGRRDKAARPVSPMAILPAEAAAAGHFLAHISIRGFRPHPEQKDHRLGRVNLIVGINGVGKTSLLEAIEFGYCGRNRRSTITLDPTAITMDLVGSPERLSSTTDAARLRARHSNWYAKTELRKVTIEDSFGKFNFLDTDAAVKLSVSGSTNQIGADVARLVLGSAAESVVDRLRRVLEKIGDELKGQRREIEVNCQNRASAANRLEQIMKSPKLSGSLFLDLTTALAQMGWRQSPADVADLQSLRERLQESIAAAERLRQAPVDVLQGDQQSALRLLASITNEARRAADLQERERAARAEHARAQRAALAAADRCVALEALLPYARTGFPELWAKVRGLANDVRSLVSDVGEVAEAISPAELVSSIDETVEAAALSAATRVEALHQLLEGHRKSLQLLESTQSSLAVLSHRLRSAAREIIDKTEDAQHCPLCHSEFESGQLLARMASDVHSGVSNQMVALLHDIAKTEDALLKARSAQSQLESLSRMMGVRAISATIGEALALAQERRGALERTRADLESARSRIAMLQREGLSDKDLSTKLLALGRTDMPPLQELEEALASSKVTLSSAHATAESALRESNEIQRECESISERLSVGVPEGADELATVLRRQVTDIESALGAKEVIESMIKVRPNVGTNDLTVLLSTAQQLVAKVATSLDQEAAGNSAMEAESKYVAELDKKIEEGQQKASNLEEAHRIFDSIERTSSGEELKNQVLTENAEEIARTFASIHMPNEFDLDAKDGALVITRRQTGARVDLDQMSTGQRAAFALSLFLAMNGRLASGPPVLLFDDPVAHVDDINVLSFLDHLRGIAISGSRQIFFATADAKLAGLFRHKFRFLGDEFQELSLSRS